MSRKSQIRKRKRQQERFEQRKLEAQTNQRPILRPRVGVTAEILDDIERRKLSNIFVEEES